MINDAPLPAKIVAYFRGKAKDDQCTISQAELVVNLWKRDIATGEDRAKSLTRDKIINSLQVNVCLARNLLSPWESLRGRKWYATYLYRQCVPMLYPIETPTETLLGSTITILQTCPETELITGVLLPWKMQINPSVKLEDARGILLMANIALKEQEITGQGLYLVHHLDKKAAWLLVWNGQVIDPLQTYQDVKTLDVLSSYIVTTMKPKIERIAKPKPLPPKPVIKHEPGVYDIDRANRIAMGQGKTWRDGLCSS